MMGILCLIAALCLPLIFVLKNGQGKKRGCGRGCAICGNRALCHPGQYHTPDSQKQHGPDH